jgi:hypothetical protein
MIRSAIRATLGAAAGLIALSPLHAQAADASAQQPTLNPAVGVEVWASTDSDKTDVLKILGRALWNFDGRDRYQGVDVEHAWFSPDGQRAREQDRIYLDLADSLGGKWRWSARIGTNGDTILGSASLRSADWSKEVFVEREVVETPRGLDQGIYYTFAGASMDLLSGGNDTVNALAGLQKFTGHNVRLHLRGTYVHVVKPSWGLSVQLRARYFHSTVPGEFDYYSPRDFVQLIPVVQWRHFDHDGWMYLAALGYGAQKATGTGWQAARLADLRLESPARSRKLHAFAQLQYSNNSLTGGAGHYHYVVGRLGLTTRL